MEVAAMPTVESPRNARGVRAHRLALDLASFYRGSISDLARAWGTTRDTARAWLEEPPTKPREDLLERAQRLSLLCRAVSRYMSGRGAAGRWTLAPHLALHGRSPAEALLEDGDEALTQLLMEMVAVAPARPDLPLADDEEVLWQRIAESLDPEDLERIEGILQGPELEVGEEDLADLAAFDESPSQSAEADVVREKPVRS